MTLASIIAAWAVLWVLVAAVVMAVGWRRGRQVPAAAWLVTIGAFLAAQEDPLLLTQMASTRPSTTGFRGGVVGLVHAHTRGHMYGAAVLALAGLGLAVVVAHAALRRGEAWAWWTLAAFWLLGTIADLFEVFGIYPHGFPLAATPADGVRGFGWPTLAAWIVIWAAGLAAAAPAALARKRQPQQVTARNLPV